MTVGALIFWLFIGGPIVLTLLYWILMIVAMPFFAAGAGARAVKESRADKRQQAIAAELKTLDDETARKTA
jgi:hypothetical protein